MDVKLVLSLCDPKIGGKLLLGKKIHSNCYKNESRRWSENKQIQDLLIKA